MTVGRVRAAHLVAALLLIASLVFLTSCGAFGGDQNTFNPAGDVAERQRDLFYAGLIPAIIILALVTAALIYIVLRFRRRSEDEAPPRQVHGNTRIEIIWTVLPVLVLAGLAVPTVDSPTKRRPDSTPCSSETRPRR